MRNTFLMVYSKALAYSFLADLEVYVIINTSLNANVKS